jgi:imidazolonepropionase-like amidohydrolase
MPSQATLASATSEAAALLGVPELGVIAAGAVAHLAIFRAPEPFSLGEALQHKPIAVLQAGRQVRGEPL